ncbi:UDP-glucosyltransferase 2-like [Arctopsyche grandis]|uniref:UDP-glucosyltransferase 2-like n=1 Tax=Arctopsyche grandis TaxID=121162 RepID=UPI00406D9BA5
MSSIRLIYILCCIYTVNSARILGIFPTPCISHQVVFRSLMQTLAIRGHHVVTMTTDPTVYQNVPNLTQIDVHNVSYAEWNKFYNFVDLKEENPSIKKILSDFFIIMGKIAERQLETPGMKQLLNDPTEKFDLCFVEALLPLMYPIKDRFNCNLILFSSLGGNIQHHEAFGSPTHPILYPDILWPFIGELDFFQRITAVYLHLLYKYVFYFESLPMFDSKAKELFGPSTRPIDEITHDADMLFLNSEPLLGEMRPIAPSVVYLGSIHIVPNKPLPTVS